MKTFTKEQAWHDVIDTIECDRCHKVIKSDSIENHFALQETFSIDIKCGYGSKTWGDLHRVEADLCEQCIYELISPFARVSRYA